MSWQFTQRALIPPHVMAREVGDEVVILDLISGTYFGLDAVGARAWQLLSDNKSLGEICETMLNEFDVERTALENDLRNLLSCLLTDGLIEIARENPGQP